MKTYTTGQIIDLLKPGQEACDVDNSDRRLYYEKTGLYIRNIHGGNPELYTIWRSDSNTKWQLLPQYVTFEEALQAYREGKKVQVEVPDYINRTNIMTLTYKDYGDGSDSVGDGFSWYIVVKGKWSIVEEDSQ